MKKKTALLSVYHKEGIEEFAQALVDRGWDILASGGTAKALLSAGIPVRDIGEIAGSPILGHRVVTLSREIHSGLLARDIPEDRAELERLGLLRIDLVCVDLYPLREVIAKPGSTRSDVIEMTDVGGPTLLHSAAKGERFVICNPKDRSSFISWLDAGSPDEETYRNSLAAMAEATVAEYCLTSGRYRDPRIDGFVGVRAYECKYGENAWQAPAALFRKNTDDRLALHNFELIAGSSPSYNNFCDIDRMLQTITHVKATLKRNSENIPAVAQSEVAVAVKHGNACGASFGIHFDELIKKMIWGDPRAIFGGLVMTTFPIDQNLAEELLHYHVSAGKRLLDGVIAPSFSPEAIELLARKEGKCRLIINPALQDLSLEDIDREPRFRQVRGGFLKQPNYTYILDFNDPCLERCGVFDPGQEKDLLLAWAVGSTSNSNTVTLVKDGRLIGNGVGQQDRVGCCELAIKRARDAGHDTVGAVAYSDSFFPFPDGPEVLAGAGIKAILASSGSVKDQEVKATCAKHGMALLMIPDALGRGFYNH
jgi:phosphoribosylaminoimidazolecarboxamide formyltransferase/IMP cyclohydrolase